MMYLYSISSHSFSPNTDHHAIYTMASCRLSYCLNINLIKTQRVILSTHTFNARMYVCVIRVGE